MARAIQNCQCGVLFMVVRDVRKGSHTVDLHLAVRGNGLDQALLLEVGDALAGQGAVNLHAVDENSDGDQAVGLDILVELLGGGLVQNNGVLGLVLDLALRPLLLLLLSSSSGRLQRKKIHCQFIALSNIQFVSASIVVAGECRRTILM